MTTPRGKENKSPLQPYRVAGVVVFLIAALVLLLVFLQYRGDFTPDYFGPVDFAALYWHIVDLIWIFLFPLLYLIH